jgi:hypothetical protein
MRSSRSIAERAPVLRDVAKDSALATREASRPLAADPANADTQHRIRVGSRLADADAQLIGAPSHRLEHQGRPSLGRVASVRRGYWLVAIERREERDRLQDRHLALAVRSVQREAQVTAIAVAILSSGQRHTDAAQLRVGRARRRAHDDLHHSAVPAGVDLDAVRPDEDSPERETGPGDEADPMRLRIRPGVVRVPREPIGNCHDSIDEPWAGHSF